MLMRPCAGEELAVARVAGRHHAVEHVDAAGDALDEVLGRPRTHQIARLVGGQAAGRLLGRRAYITSTGSPTLSPPIA